MAKSEMRDVIVLLPGILGSELRKNGKLEWGFRPRVLGRALLAGGRSIRRALFLEEDPEDVDDLGDGVTADRLLPDLHLLPGLWKVDGYSRIEREIKRRFEVTEGENFFTFPYDWRRSNRVTARRLARLSHEWLGRWRESQNSEAKLILVAHSMGGLVSRYYLEILEGWNDTRALLTFGTPYRGSLNAVDALSNGIRKAGGLIDLTELARSLTSLYQLLPIYECYDPGNGDLLRVGETDGIPGIDAGKAASGLAFHREIRTAVDDHLEDDAYRTGRYRVHPVVGLHQRTAQSARLAGDKVEILAHLGGDDLGGDGTVPRVSATPIEYSDAGREMYAATKHGSLQNANSVIEQLAGIFTGLSIDLGDFLKAPTQLSLEIDDLLLDSEPVEIRARPVDEAENGLGLTARVVDEETNEAVATETLSPSDDGWYVRELPPLAPGAYAVTVTGDGVEPAEDAFAVADEEEM